ncbi:membrane dipeptidase [Alphaproteobacteria bacterium]|nr:membrane dipeptidase [Alphaproteobacteria bacterium]
MKNENMLIDGLEYCNWNRELFEKAHEGGLNAIHATLVYWEDTNESFEKINYWDNLIKSNSDILLHVRKSRDIIEAKKLNKIGIIYGFQNSAPIANDIFLVEKFFAKGLRFMQLTYNNQTPLAGGCYEKKDSGVSRFGEMVIEEMNRLGLIVDLSHAGKQTCLDAIEFSKKPVAISHANPNFFHKSIRNIDDDVLKKLSDKNGFIGLSLYPYHLKNHGDCKVEDFCQMIKQLINIMGEDSIGIGSDLCLNWSDDVVMWMRNGKWTKKIDYGESKNKNASWPKPASWYSKPEDLSGLVDTLISNGINEKTAHKVGGSNWLNFMSHHF